MNISPSCSPIHSRTGSYEFVSDDVSENDEDVNPTAVEDPPEDPPKTEPETNLNLDEFEEYLWLTDPAKCPPLNEEDYDGCEFLDSRWEPPFINLENPPSYLQQVFGIIQELQPSTSITSIMSTVAEGGSSFWQWGYYSSQELFQSIGLTAGVVNLAHALVVGKNTINSRFVFSEAQARQIKDAALKLEEKRRAYFWLRAEDREKVNADSAMVKQGIEGNVMYAAALVIQYSISNGLHQTATGSYEWVLYKTYPSRSNQIL